MAQLVTRICFLLFPWLIQSQLSYSSDLNEYSSLNNLSKQTISMVQSNDVYATSSLSPSSSSLTHRSLVGNLSQTFTFQVVPDSIKVTYLGLNGYSLYIMGVGFSNKSKFHYDEQNNRLTIVSLDATTVGHYSAVDTNWRTFTTIISAINVSSFEIENFRVSEQQNRSSSVSCSVSIIRSNFKEIDLFSSSNSFTSNSNGIDYLPRLNLFLSTRISSSFLPLSNEKIINDTLIGQHLIRSISMQRSLTRADHNGTIQCQIESTNNHDVYLTKTELVDILFGPNLEAAALEKVTLESEVLKIIHMECQIEANPTPSYVWYEISSNITDSTTNFGQQSIESSPTVRSVFGTHRQIQRIYQHSGQYSMQCQAQANGKTVQQNFQILVQRPSQFFKIHSDMNTVEQKSSKIPMILGISVGVILLILLVAIVVAVYIYLKRRKTNPNDSMPDKSSNDKSHKTRWGNLPIDYSKYKSDSSSTSHLVESVENPSIQAPSTGTRSSPVNSRHSSYRQTPTTVVSLSYRQASALPGFRPLTSNNSYSAEQDELDEVSTSIVIRPSTINRSRTTTPLGSHKSLSASIQSLRSNQQVAVSLPMKKRSHDLPTLTKRDEKNPSNHDYQHHHYQNPANLQTKTDNTSSDDDEEQREIAKQTSSLPSNYADPLRMDLTTKYNYVDPHPLKENHYASSCVSERSLMPNQMKEKEHDEEIPPSYHQIANNSTHVNAYIYREPTEV